MDIDKYNQAEKLLIHINYNQRRAKRINEFLGRCNDRVSGFVKRILGDDYDYSILDNSVNNELKAYRDRLEEETEQLKKEFEEL